MIVGEIEDEHSPVAEVPEQSADCEWRIAGGEAIAEVGDILGIEFEPSGVYSTLGGFIIAELGSFPEEGDSVRFAGHCFMVEEMDRFRVVSVRVQCVQPTPFE